VFYIHQPGESKQVEGHLRSCLKIDSTVQKQVAPSLCATYAIMTLKKPIFKAPDALDNGGQVCDFKRRPGRVLLLFIMARDGLVGPADHLFKPLSGKRQFPTDTSSAGTLDTRKWTKAHLRLWSLSRAISPTRNYA